MEIKHLIVGPLLTNCYLIFSKNEAAVIDPGGGVKTILKEIENSKAKLKYIILTHGHWDHTLSVLKIKDKTGAKILLHEAEKEFVKFKVDEFLREGSEIKIGDSVLKVIHTPGHSKGSICLLGDGFIQHQRFGAGFIFTGDTIFKDGYGRTDLEGGSQEDLENSLKKLEKILKPRSLKLRFISRLAPLRGTQQMKVYPGHGETFEIE